MKAFASIVATLCIASSAMSAFAAERTVVDQFRIDYEAIVRRAWGVKSPDRAADVKREVDQFVEGLKSFRPSLLHDAQKIPSDADIQNRWEKLVAIEGSSLERGSPLWQYYVPLWRERKMNRLQKVIFSRMMAGIEDEHAERKRPKG